MIRLRWRLAAWLLGFRPVRVPDAEGVYIVYRSAPGDYRLEAVFTADKFRMRMQSTLPAFDDADPTDYRGFRATRTGRFVGTVKVA